MTTTPWRLHGQYERGAGTPEWQTAHVTSTENRGGIYREIRVECAIAQVRAETITLICGETTTQFKVIDAQYARHRQWELNMLWTIRQKRGLWESVALAATRYSIVSFSSGGCGGRQPPALFLSKYALQ